VDAREALQIILTVLARQEDPFSFGWMSYAARIEESAWENRRSTGKNHSNSLSRV
jgi:hypothetical protein